MSTETRNGLLLISLGTFVFVVALFLFCFALGLNFESEGWSETVAGEDGRANWSVTQMAASSAGFLVSIVLFFWGVQKVAK